MTNLLMNPERLRQLGIACHSFSVTPGASALAVPASMGLFIGVSGDVEVIDASGATTVFENVPVGWFPVAVTHVLATNTTASAIVGLA